MELRWVTRRAHARRLPAGGTAYVRGSWVLTKSGSDRKRRSHRSPCPKCGAGVLSVNMPNGGWGHFEGAEGLSRVKHPCFDRRMPAVRRGDDGNLDLFEQQDLGGSLKLGRDVRAMVPSRQRFGCSTASFHERNKRRLSPNKALVSSAPKPSASSSLRTNSSSAASSSLPKRWVA